MLNWVHDCWECDVGLRPKGMVNCSLNALSTSAWGCGLVDARQGTGWIGLAMEQFAMIGGVGSAGWQVAIAAMAAQDLMQCWGRWCTRYPPLFTMGLMAWNKGWAGLFACQWGIIIAQKLLYKLSLWSSSPSWICMVSVEAKKWAWSACNCATLARVSGFVRSSILGTRHIFIPNGNVCANGA